MDDPHSCRAMEKKKIKFFRIDCNISKDILYLFTKIKLSIWTCQSQLLVRPIFFFLVLLINGKEPFFFFFTVIKIKLSEGALQNRNQEMIQTEY